jgi:hypothetical protein
LAGRPTEALAELVTELVDEVATRDQVTRYRSQRRGPRTVTVAEVLTHRTRQVGLLDQLRAVIPTPSAGRLVRLPALERTRVSVEGPARAGEPWPVTYAFQQQVRVPVIDWHGRQRRNADGQPVTQPASWIRRDNHPAAGVVIPGAAVPQGSPGWDDDGALQPSRGGGARSRPPATEALELLDAIDAGARRLCVELRSAARQQPGRRVDTAAALRELVGLVSLVDEATARSALARVRSWVLAARVLLRYDAPIVALRDVVCRACGGELRVRADASSDVWCAAHISVEGPAYEGEPWPVTYPCGQRYPRWQWIELLEGPRTPI